MAELIVGQQHMYFTQARFSDGRTEFSSLYRVCITCSAVKREEKNKRRDVFTALQVMQTRYSDENSVRPSVCLSVCHTRGL